MSRVQPDHDPAFQELHTFLSQSSIEVCDTTKDEHLEPHEYIIPRSAVKTFLSENNYERAEALVQAQFGRDARVSPRDVAEICPVVSCVLADIGKFGYIHTFVGNGNLRDQRMPFLSDNGHAPSFFPKITSYADFWNDFDRAQWKFYAQSLESHSGMLIDSRYILPFVHMEEKKNGNTATVRKVKLHPDYDNMKHRSRSGSVYALKTFGKYHGRKEHDHENTTFGRIARKDSKSIRGIIEYYGSFEHRGWRNIVLEWADGGTLEELLTAGVPPSSGEDIVAFWESYFDVAHGLFWIHEPHHPASSSNSPELRRGWHQDLKPTNLLRVRSSAKHAYQGFVFKIADFGLSDIKTVVNDGEPITTRHRWGTSTYGAPECHALSSNTESRYIQIEQKTDVWSFGAITSEVAYWVVKGITVEDYRQAREDAHAEDFAAPDCFHDGTDVLPMVHIQHDNLKANTRRTDHITAEVLDRMVTEMLWSSPGQRPSAEQLVARGEARVREARQKLPGAKNPMVHRNPSAQSAPPPEKYPMHASSPSIGEMAQFDSPSSDKPYQNEAVQMPKRVRTSGDVGQHDASLSPIRPATQETYNDQPSPSRQRRQDSFDPNVDKYGKRPIRSPTGNMNTHTRDISGASGLSHNTQPELDYLSVKEASDFREKRARGVKGEPMPFEQQLKQLLDKRDHVFMIDDSRTMIPHWKEVEVLIDILAYFVKRFDPDGCELFFLSSKESRKFSNATKARQIVRDGKPNNSAKTNLARLSEDVQNYVGGKKSRLSWLSSPSSEIPRARTVYILTDGVLEDGDDKQGQDAIRMLVEKMTAKGVLRGHVGIQFISFGKNPNGLERLRQLDELGRDPDVFTDEPHRNDFVDTEPSTGNVLTMLMGSLNPKYDNFGEASREPRSSVTSPVTSRGNHAAEHAHAAEYPQDPR